MRKTLLRSYKMSKLVTVKITETDGTDWGIWTGFSEEDVIADLLDSIKNNPENYNGCPVVKNLRTEMF
jgi:hypothetical protein